MRLAIVDLMFSWPPHGGADVDMYHVLKTLVKIGQDVHLFGAAERGSWERGAFDPDTLPFPATRIELAPGDFAPRRLVSRVQDVVIAWRPDAVIVADGFFLKPFVWTALSAYPTMARYFAHEFGCHRDVLRFKNGAPCPNHYLHTPDACRACAFEWLSADIKHGHALAWTREYLAASAYQPAYHATLKNSLSKLKGFMVYNAELRDEFLEFSDNVFITAGGVDLDAFPYTPPAARGAGDKKIIFMAGRAEDPAKGVQVLHEAGARLWEERRDFEIRVTLPEDTPRLEWFQPLGWRSHHEIVSLYAESDIVVVPSIWNETFGIVAVEAMAVGRPVCASRAGGLKDSVRHLETGFHFERGDAAELAKQLALLLDNPDLRLRMGEAGRKRAEDEFAWERIVAKHYTPILAFLAAHKKGGTCASHS